ncbi:unnamed protein product [Effrenium voratum]|nr:unnamed protein product [Effrenium voratum]
MAAEFQSKSPAKAQPAKAAQPVQAEVEQPLETLPPKATGPAPLTVAEVDDSIALERQLSQADEVQPERGEVADTDIHLLVPSLGQSMSDHDKQVAEQIDLDVPRTFPKVPEVDQQREAVRRVLLTYSKNNPHIGYCQGMSFPAAVFCANLAEPEATEKFHCCLEKIRELWLPGFHVFETAKQAFDSLLALQSPTLSRSLQTQGIILDVFLLDAWLTLFARWLPFAMLPQVLEFVEFHGFSGMLCLTVAVVESHGQAIIGVEKHNALLELWQCLQWDAAQPRVRTLLEVARGLMPKASELLAEQCTLRQKNVQLPFERRGPQIVHADTGTDILELLSEESWEKWKAQAETFRKAPRSEHSEKDTKSSKSSSFLNIFKCGRHRADSDDMATKSGRMDKE